jgi:hypothetical protein
MGFQPEHFYFYSLLFPKVSLRLPWAKIYWAFSPFFSAIQKSPSLVLDESHIHFSQQQCLLYKKTCILIFLAESHIHFSLRQRLGI